jgi:uncharacterized membrane protein YkvA (DUF1232 family)
VSLPSRIQRVASLLSDPRVPKLPRLAVAAAAIYLLSPIDLVPELALPLAGWLDDITLVWLAIRWLVKKGDAATGGLLPPERNP